jgi:hypothetical protein
MISDELRNALLEQGFQPDLENPGEVRDAIKARLASLHPDKRGGQFVDKAQQDDFQHIKELLERFDQEITASTQMVPIQHVTSLVEILLKAQAASLATTSSANTYSNNAAPTEDYRRHLKRKYAFPKLTSALFATLCFALFSLLGNFKGNHFYRRAVDYYVQDSKANIIAGMDKRTWDITSKWYGISASYGNTARLIEDFKSGELSNDELHEAIVRDNFFRDENKHTNELVEFEDIKDVVNTDVVNNMITDIDLFSATEPAFLASIKQKSDFLTKRMLADVESLRSSNPKNRSGSGMKSSLITRVGYYQESVSSLDGLVKTTEDWLSKEKARALEQADGRIFRRLALLTILACSAFVLVWIRERSDEKWVEFLSSDEGLEVVLARLCANETVRSRPSPQFSLSEFTKAMGTKDTPRGLSFILGKYLDVKHLGQVSKLALNRLKERKVIAEIDVPTIQPWFEVKIQEYKIS